MSVPGSTANLGPGFDCLALAVDLPFGLWVCEPGEMPPAGLHRAEPTHPATVAFLEAGGDRQAFLWWRSPIPPGRGLGFSGAARVAGAFAARLGAGDDVSAARRAAFEVAQRLEGHGDNAAASTYGGFVVVADSTVVPVDVPRGVSVLTWSPPASTSTVASREGLPRTVAFDDAAFSTARAALWVAALAGGRTALLREACNDRLHQPTRLRANPAAAVVIEALADTAGVWAAWLSGSGPTVAALVDAKVVADPESVELPLEPRGALRLLEVNRSGAIET